MARSFARGNPVQGDAVAGLFERREAPVRDLVPLFRRDLVAAGFEVGADTGEAAGPLVQFLSAVPNIERICDERTGAA